MDESDEQSNVHFNINNSKQLTHVFYFYFYFFGMVRPFLIIIMKTFRAMATDVYFYKNILLGTGCDRHLLINKNVDLFYLNRIKLIDLILY